MGEDTPDIRRNTDVLTSTCHIFFSQIFLSTISSNPRNAGGYLGYFLDYLTLISFMRLTDMMRGALCGALCDRLSWRHWLGVDWLVSHVRELQLNGASYAYSYYSTLIENPTPGIQLYLFEPPSVTLTWDLCTVFGVLGHFAVLLLRPTVRLLRHTTGIANSATVLTCW